MSEVEYKGIKLKGSKLLLILPLLGTLGGALWAGFEGYARWVAMEKKINEYVAPDLSGFTLRLEVLEERIVSLQDNVNIETSTQYMIGDAGKNLNNLIQHASDRFDAKRTSIEESAQRRQDFLTDEMKNLEDRFDTKLQRALSNPLAGQ